MSRPLALLILLLGSLPSVAVMAAESAPATPQLGALDVAQPDGWDKEVALQPAPDLNPDPNILEVNIEAKIADVEIKPGMIVKAWTYNGLLPGPYLKAKVGDRLIVHFKNSLVLADAMLRGGRPYELVPLVGTTHMLNDPALAIPTWSRMASFLRTHLNHGLSQ